MKPSPHTVVDVARQIEDMRKSARSAVVVVEPIPMLLSCPCCHERHIDEGQFATLHHHTHACQKCGMVWRPALVHTVGVRFLPGFKNDE